MGGALMPGVDSPRPRLIVAGQPAPRDSWRATARALGAAALQDASPYLAPSLERGHSDRQGDASAVTGGTASVGTRGGQERWRADPAAPAGWAQPPAPLLPAG